MIFNNIEDFETYGLKNYTCFFGDLLSCFFRPVINILKQKYQN